MPWPTTEITDANGQTQSVPYCCWTFCAWPELAKLLRISNLPRCNKCPKGRS